MLGTSQNIKRSLGRLASSQLQRQVGRVSVVSFNLREKSTVSTVFSKQVDHQTIIYIVNNAIKPKWELTLEFEISPDLFCFFLNIVGIHNLVFS